jgi:catechol 2,3-dioxygenase-like lactoylglutathione lyase family enzyme
MNLNQVTITVTNVEKSIDFYTKIGLKIIVKADHYARFVCPDGDSTFSIHLGEVVKNNSIQIYFEVKDVDATIKELQNKGVVILSEKQKQSWLWDEAKIQDPDGYTIIIYYAGANRKDPPWKVR